MLSFKEVDPSVLGPKYKKVKAKDEFVSDAVAVEEACRKVENEMNEKPENDLSVSVKEAVDKTKEFINKAKPDTTVMYVDTRPVIAPCPFCGKEASIKTDMFAGKYAAQVKCLSCGSSGPRITDHDHDGTFVFEALGIWNERR